VTGIDAEATRTTRLGRAIAPRADAHPGLTGIHALGDAREAFAARWLLAESAERSLDLQYYIWHGDRTGTLLFAALRQAADRGVRVRLLLDDNNTAGLDGTLAELASHPGIELRLFNPLRPRRPRLLAYLLHFGVANRRMHNKSFIADAQAAIVGGRNIGDEYFDASDDVAFADLDVLAVGQTVRDIASDFDRYWACASACPAESVLSMATRPPPPVPPVDSAKASAYLQAVRQSSFIRELSAGNLPLTWAPACLVSDDPAKGLAKAAAQSLLTHELHRALGTPARSVDLVSPYFVPTAVGEQAFGALARRGIAVRVLTNALESTDVLAVHAGYAKRRRRLLQAGVRLFEMRASAAHRPKNRSAGPFGSSSSSLHAKTFAIDGSRAFVGSFNFDPRSARLNTEMGLVIESAELAGNIDQAFAGPIAAQSYEVRLGDHGRLCWLERHGEHTIRHATEPGTKLWKRLVLGLVALLPVEWLL